ncbi:MAG: hypothetical protein EZS28_014365 [Streblomastix strix]|uniref:RRM domain-containing protein n=1 Tax=Streblomastix strix TaxID=222440 RepID=A0A5J4W5F8_9EUKA|nr:MAG: hypothetical protein EZS28_014365 [Streblomastix strix]
MDIEEQPNTELDTTDIEPGEIQDEKNEIIEQKPDEQPLLTSLQLKDNLIASVILLTKIQFPQKDDPARDFEKFGQNIVPSKSLVVFNVDNITTKAIELYQLFEQCGKVNDIYFITKYSACVTFEDLPSAEKAKAV